MKAVVLDGFGGPEVLHLTETADPVPNENQVLIQVEASSVNRPDIIQREGHYPPPPGASDIPGLECAGRLPSGDRVFALVSGGGYAELCVAEADHALPVPDNLSFEQAACIAETYITAWHNLFCGAQLANGESVLLHGGGGGVNSAAIQLVRNLCPDSRIFVTASRRKIDGVASLGADVIINYQDQDFASTIKQETGGRGVDVILDHIGAGYFESNMKSLGVNGRLVVIGIMQGDRAEISLGRMMVKRQQLIGSVLRPRPNAEKAAIIARFAEQVMPLFESGRIAPLIDSIFPLERVADAHRRMEAGEHFGKIVLSMT